MAGMNKPLAAELAAEEPARLTVDEFLAIVTGDGPLSDWTGKIELVEGMIVRIDAAMNLHLYCQRQVFLKLDAIFGEGLKGHIAVQEPTFRFDDFNTRDPDVAIMKDVGPIRDINRTEDMALAVEISDTTLAKNRGPKRLAYAGGGVPVYWIVDVEHRRVELFSQPTDGDYLKKETVSFGEPLNIPLTDKTIVID